MTSRLQAPLADRSPLLAVAGARWRALLARKPLPPGAMIPIDQLERTRRTLLLDLAAQHGPVFKGLMENRLVVCVLGLAAGRRVLEEHAAALRPVAIRIESVVPQGFLRRMEGDRHREVRGALVRALAALDWAAMEDELASIVADELAGLESACAGAPAPWHAWSAVPVAHRRRAARAGRLRCPARQRGGRRAAAGVPRTRPAWRRVAGARVGARRTMAPMTRSQTTESHRRPFHLAFPVHDLEAARAFYAGLLGCGQGRESPGEWIDFDLYGHQVVAHLAPGECNAGATSAVDERAVPVRHFGVVLPMDEWQALAARLEREGVRFVIEPYVRFKGLAGEQATMFFLDPSGNALEFKAFADLNQLFAKQ
jgi:extradiol dioxygenase family protein